MAEPTAIELEFSPDPYRMALRHGDRPMDGVSRFSIDSQSDAIDGVIGVSITHELYRVPWVFSGTVDVIDGSLDGWPACVPVFPGTLPVSDAKDMTLEARVGGELWRLRFAVNDVVIDVETFRIDFDFLNGTTVHLTTTNDDKGQYAVTLRYRIPRSADDE